MEGLSIEQIFEKNKGRDAKFYANLYTTMTNEQRNAFKELSIDRQLYLLQVPQKKRANYKKNGVESYLESREQKGTRNHVTKYITIVEKNYVTSRLKNGKPVEYDE